MVIEPRSAESVVHEAERQVVHRTALEACALWLFGEITMYRDPSDVASAATYAY